MTLRRFADLPATPWRNGRGITRDVVTITGADGAMRWQVSIAELTEDCAFSDYAGFDRVFTPVAGDGISLSHDGGPFQPCPLLTPHAFPGEARTLCRTGGSPGSGHSGRAFNVITARGLCHAEVTVLHLAAGAHAGPVEALHCWSGLLRAEAGDAGPGDTLLGCAAVAAAPSVAVQVRVVRP